MTEESHHLITCCYFHYHLFVKSIEADFCHLPINFNVKPLRCGCTGWVLSGKSKYDIERHCKYNVHQAYIEKVEKEGVQQASIEKFVDEANGNEAARLKMAGTCQGCLNDDDKAFCEAVTKQFLQNGIPHQTCHPHREQITRPVSSVAKQPCQGRLNRRNLYTRFR